MSGLFGSHSLRDRPRTFIIAEAGVNHDGDLERARELVEIAARAGADAVKFQTFRAHCLAIARAPKAAYQVETTGEDESQLEMLRRLELGREEHEQLQQLCEERGILFLSTPFDEESADLLEELGVPAFKVGSGELTNLPFLTHLAGKGKPIILSTGMSHIAEVTAAVECLRAGGCRQLALLHCVSCYPARPEDTNLRALDTLAERFDVPVGYSDHTPGVEVALAAVARGARILEKHFTSDKTLPGPDHRASLDPGELELLVRGVRIVESALGDGHKKPVAAEEDVRRTARKSLVAARDVPAGTRLTPALLAALRPGTGISPADTAGVLGRRVGRDLREGELIAWDDLEPERG